MGSRISVEDITFNYPGGAPVFTGITLTVDEGCVYSLLGPNGTGKSTLLKCMAGLISPSHGRVLLDGHDIAGMQPHEIARRIGFVPQTQVSPFPFLVRDIVLMGRAAHLGPFSTPSSEDEEIAADALDRIGISHLAERPCTEISGGEWQLVLIARAIAQRPGILLLDEPTSHLDLGNQVRVLNVIRGLAEDGMTIVVATHFPDHALLTSSQVAILKNQRILAMGGPNEVINEDTMRRAYGTDVRIVNLGDPINRQICVPVAGWVKP
ncbi:MULTISPECIES: ABC transporter ATP-binding protein [Methanoculleus]|jgi:iron complex transport system ATP-binding protein|uniref:Cobalamin import ATP-binding protein BtuD n=1 Tax=Methanoculleus thermophilus TaxID=2200 RepID=A0A1G8XBB7_9EURY|nr:MULTISPECIES: ABC transporter ATP-binding protein [Methanoculleus]NLN09452.1 ABC transporter ATP-binding protein [Methanoculleus thermophilus]SDJ87902.1 iron complex transport system ATP-binding protein [Methanoculleus thermophilus]